MDHRARVGAVVLRAAVDVNRRRFLAATAGLVAHLQAGGGRRARRILLRSSWQTVNIGDIAHTPGLLALLERHRPEADVTLWPNPLSPQVEALLRRRFPRLQIASTPAAQDAALASCDFFLHGSGPGLVGATEAERARMAGKPYGFAGITLNDDEIRTRRTLLGEARFVCCRDTDSLRALRRSGVSGPGVTFGPDATFALDLGDAPAASALMAAHGLEPGRFLCAVPRLRWTPYWEIHPDRVKPDPERIAVNDGFAERDHAKLREGIAAWVRATGMKVFLVPEMTYAVSRLRPLLFDGLPAEVKPQVAVLDRYWLTDEAAGVYARAAAVASFEQHSPIIAIANGTPAVLLRQPTDTRKGQMWRDIGLDDWIFEIDRTTGTQVAERLLAIARDIQDARVVAERARERAHRAMADMIGAIP
jgi:polysaccharide pyruvyl transferase WcaK-like protein